MKPALALLAALTLCAQTPRRRPMIPDPADELKFDTPQVRVLVDTELPFETEAPRQHPMNRVLIFLDAAHFEQTSADGRVEDYDIEANTIRWSRAGDPYIIENKSGHPLRIVEIHLKTGEDGSARRLPETKLDPTEVDAQHYKVEFENPQVRVLRIHFGPHEKSPLHEHQLNRVVVYINDQAKLKAGDVRISPPGTHTEENDGDTPADRIAVEIK
jgi:hypothetical protein